LIALAAFFLRDLFNAARIVLNNTFEQKVIFDLRSDLYAHIQQLPLTWFDNRATGDIMTRVLEDVNAVERVLIDGIEQGVVAVLQIVVVSALLFVYQPRLAALALLPIPFLLAGALTYTLTAHRRYRLQRKASSAMNALLHDNLAGIRQIKTYVREPEEHQRFNKVSDQLRQATLVVMRVWAIYNPAMSFFTACGLVIVVGCGGFAVIEGTMSVGDLVGFLLLAGFLYEPIGRLHSLNQLVQAGRAAGERVFEILDEKAEPGSVAAGDETATAVALIKGDVRFRNVSFAYSDEVPVLHNITLHARPGETIALVGPSGAGKTTLCNLVARFYDPTRGRILVDGHDLRDLDVESYRQAVGIVEQDVFLFDGTIAENIAYGARHVSERQIRAAAALANADEFIKRMPLGYETIIGERGVKLSGGQRQRLAIARAVLADPPILILDEATSNLDTHSERLIQAALTTLMRDRTSLVIAHRLSTIAHASRIIVLDAGRIAEIGTHDALMAAGGRYHEMVLMQTGDTRAASAIA
jgi:ABC-type multidrug transport system fused ATPase/permease subunit